MRVPAGGREGLCVRALANSIEVDASRDALFRDADVLSLHLALSEETAGIVSAADLAKMKPSVLFVNSSRAALIKPGALEEALRRASGLGGGRCVRERTGRGPSAAAYG
jgi:D-3-phosphoglycerate dehydrogenase / 2-oxoglutarate reductase